MLQQLKTALVELLEADPYFSTAPGIPVLDERKHELDNEIDRAIAEIGQCVFVAVVRATSSSPSLKDPTSGGRPYFDDVTIIFRCFERPILNDDNTGAGLETDKSGLQTAMTVAALVHMFMPFGDNHPVVVEQISLGDDPGRVSHDVVCKHNGGINYEVPRVELPEIAEDAGEITLTCDTANAQIFYTTNSNAPVPRTATIYTAPFIVAAGTRVRVRAWLAGYLASKEVSLTTS